MGSFRALASSVMALSFLSSGARASSSSAGLRQARAGRGLELADWMNEDAVAPEEGGDDTCMCPCNCNATAPDESEVVTVRILSYEPYGVDQISPNARDYMRLHPNVKIEAKVTETLTQLYEEIESDAKSGGGLFDAYYTNPIVMGTAATHGGFLDLTPYIKDNPKSEWTDVLPALRNYVTSFEDKIYMVLLDGDTHSMFYRKDVLDHFDLQPPRTWNEYISVASKVHGKTFLNKTLSGSCVSRIGGDHAQFWAHLILSSITQTKGTSTGSLFDSRDMTPLAGEAIAEMIRIQEEQAKYGTPDEFLEGHNDVMNQNMNDGNCVLTFFWADLFRRSKADGALLHDRLGIAPTPGSEWVLNRETGKLERCDGTICPYAEYYEDIGWVNSAPYAAIGGWGVAVSANTAPEKQRAMVDFALWASSREQSEQYVVARADAPIAEINGQDPWRKSHLDVDKWVARGYDRELATQFAKTVMGCLLSKNVVVENRWPKAGEVMNILDLEVAEYLYMAHNTQDGMRMDDVERRSSRLRVADRIRDRWNYVIRAYDERGDTVAPILEVYQRLRGVWVPRVDRNLLDGVRPVGYTFFAIIVVAALGSSAWVFVKRNAPVIKAAQPAFLYLIATGMVVMASSIIPMGFDDGIASEEACSRACMAVPWLFTIGFTVSFASLFSKIWRLQRVMDAARAFQRIQITVYDVLLPFAVLITLNVAFLLAWTIADPLRWVREATGRNDQGELTSVGYCASSGKASKAMLGLIVGVNMLAVVLSCIKAVQTRNIKVAFNESTYVGLSIFSILQAALVGVPVLLLADENPTASYLVRSGLVFVICMALFGWIFVPKFVLAKKIGPAEMRDIVLRSSQTSAGVASSSFSTSRSITSSIATAASVVPGSSFASAPGESLVRKSSAGASRASIRLTSIEESSETAPRGGTARTNSMETNEEANDGASASNEIDWMDRTEKLLEKGCNTKTNEQDRC